MKISLLNTEYSNEDYNIYINADGQRYTYGSYQNGCIKKNSIVELIIENQILNSKYSVFYIMFYWLCSLISGTGEKEPLGRPYTLKLKFKVCNEGDMVIRVNEYKADKPFSVLSGDVDILFNEFVLEKCVKRKWILGAALPQIILVTLLNALFLYIGIQAETWISGFCYVLLFVFGIVEIYFCIRCYKILARK